MTPADGGDRTYDVRIWSVTPYQGKRGTTYQLRWRTAGQRHRETLATRKQADSFRSRLLVAAREGEGFDVNTGLPVSMLTSTQVTTWVESACRFVDSKWSHASPRHRKGLAEGLTTATAALLPDSSQRPAAALLRRLLTGWCFNSAARRHVDITQAEPPEGMQDAARWVMRHSPFLAELQKQQTLLVIRDALSRNLDGTPASTVTIRRKRSAILSALQYAVEGGLLAENPMTGVRMTRAPPYRPWTVAWS